MFADLLVAIQDSIPELDQKGLSRRSVSTVKSIFFSVLALMIFNMLQCFKILILRNIL